METLFREAKPILEKLHEAGYQAYFVGGAVRDLLLNREIGDLDIATSAKPAIIQQLFEKTIDVGAEHGTIIVLHNKRSYEVTTFRTESAYEDFRRPSQVTFISSLKEDLRRRDFTINSMAMDIDGNLYDYFDGQQHLNDRMIQTVGKASERFSEDALRMLRAIRFVSQLQFSLNGDTKTAIIQNVSLLKNISTERKTVEFEKMLSGVHHQKALQIMIDTRVYVYLPGLDSKRTQLLRFSQYNLSMLKSREEQWTMFVHHMEIESIDLFLKEWKLPSKLIQSVVKNVALLHNLRHTDWTSLTLYQAGLITAMQVERVRLTLSLRTDNNDQLMGLETLYNNLPIKARDQLAVSGNDIVKVINQKPGPWISKVLAILEKKVIDGELENEKQAMKEWLLTCKQDFDPNY
ncbi:CCA tRNA nucleotidyltransferase [Metabacillus herbersteinensis]|uniref:CCA-adding enzyme n=1 Tax=Metabacillus herbersteinensis TaxID=283816 RepID=A0ABV6GEL0_9BACI